MGRRQYKGKMIVKIVAITTGIVFLLSDVDSFETGGEFSKVRRRAHFQKNEEWEVVFSKEYMEWNAINAVGEDIEHRFCVPEGYERVLYEKGSFQMYVREYPLKTAGSKVLLHNGEESDRQWMAAAVFALPQVAGDLQQCADCVMRMYAEYFFATDQHERVAFHYVDGTYHEWKKWGSYDGTYENMIEFLQQVFNYANTVSLAKESRSISVSDIEIGDIFIRPGFPGHVVMVVDLCMNEEGKKAFLLAQGLMPAQDFHVIKNTAQTNDPWYYEDEVINEFDTPGYKFKGSDCMRVLY